MTVYFSIDSVFQGGGALGKALGTRCHVHNSVFGVASVFMGVGVLGKSHGTRYHVIARH